MEMGAANSLHAPAYYSEYNERFDLIYEGNMIAKVSTSKAVRTRICVDEKSPIKCRVYLVVE